MTRSDIHFWTIVSSLEDGRYNTLFMRVVLTKDGPIDVTLAWRLPTFSSRYRRINTCSGVVLTSMVRMLYDESSWMIGLKFCMQSRSALQTTLLYREYTYIQM